MCLNETQNAGGRNIFPTFENFKDIIFCLIFQYESPSENCKWKKTSKKALGQALGKPDLDHEM